MGKVLCSKNQNFPNPLSEIPVRAECFNDSGVINTVGSLSIPVIEGVISVTLSDVTGATYQDSGLPVGANDNVAGKDINFVLQAGVSKTIQICVDSECDIDDGCKDVTIPSAERCRFDIVTADPCNCDNIIGDPADPYFREVITINTSSSVSVDNLKIESINGNLLNQNGQAISSTATYPKIVETGPGQYRIIFYHKGTAANGNGYTIEISGADGWTSERSNTCTHTCDCSTFNLTIPSLKTICVNDTNIVMAYSTTGGEDIELLIQQVIGNTVVEKYSNLFALGTDSVQFNVDNTSGSSQIRVTAVKKDGSFCSESKTMQLDVVQPITSCMDEQGNPICGERTNLCGTYDCEEIPVILSCGAWSPECPLDITEDTIITQTRTCTVEKRNKNGFVCSTGSRTETRSKLCYAEAPAPSPSSSPGSTPPAPSSSPFVPPSTPPAPSSSPAPLVYGACCSGNICIGNVASINCPNGFQGEGTDCSPNPCITVLDCGECCTEINGQCYGEDLICTGGKTCNNTTCTCESAPL